jgi:hypothetical protein
MAAQQTFSTDIEWRGKRHTVVITGSFSPSFAFRVPGSARRQSRSPSGRLRFTCAICGDEAVFPFTAPSADWRRPFSVHSVTHHEDD